MGACIGTGADTSHAPSHRHTIDFLRFTSMRRTLDPFGRPCSVPSYLSHEPLPRQVRILFFETTFVLTTPLRNLPLYLIREKLIGTDIDRRKTLFLTRRSSSLLPPVQGPHPKFTS